MYCCRGGDIIVEVIGVQGYGPQTHLSEHCLVIMVLSLHDFAAKRAALLLCFAALLRCLALLRSTDLPSLDARAAKRSAKIILL